MDTKIQQSLSYSVLLAKSNETGWVLRSSTVLYLIGVRTARMPNSGQTSDFRNKTSRARALVSLESGLDNNERRMYARLDKSMRGEECALRHGKGMNNLGRVPCEPSSRPSWGKNRCVMDAVGNRPDWRASVDSLLFGLSSSCVMKHMRNQGVWYRPRRVHACLQLFAFVLDHELLEEVSPSFASPELISIMPLTLRLAEKHDPCEVLMSTLYLVQKSRVCLDQTQIWSLLLSARADDINATSAQLGLNGSCATSYLVMLPLLLDVSVRAQIQGHRKI